MSVAVEAVVDLHGAGARPDFSLGVAVPDFLTQAPVEHILFDAKRQHASRYLSRDFGLYIRPEGLSNQHVLEVERLETHMAEFRALARSQQNVRNLSATIHEEKEARYTTRMGQIVSEIVNFSLVQDGVLQSQYNGRVTLNQEDADKRALAGVLFLLSYRKPNYSVARALTETSGALLSNATLEWPAWDELAEKFDGFYGRLPAPYASRAIALLPNDLRLLAYGHRMGLGSTERGASGYYQEIVAQADSLDRFDRLVNLLRQSGKRQLSYENAVQVFWHILNLPFLDGELGAFRQRDPMMVQFEKPIHRQLLFLLRATEDIGLEGMDHLQMFIGSLFLKGRAEMGAIPGSLMSALERIVGRDVRKRRDEFSMVRERTQRTANHIG